MLGLEILDRPQEKTKIELKFEQAPHNKRINTLIQGAFPFADVKKTKVFIKIKSKDAEKLDLAFEDFIANVIQHAAEQEELSSLRDDLMKTVVQVGHVGSNTILMFDLNQNEVGNHMDSVVNPGLEAIKKLESQVSISFSTATTFKELLRYVH